MIEVKAPNEYYLGAEPTVFLAGSIEMGTAVEWQRELITSVQDLDVLILNPRRDNWNTRVKQSIDDPEFAEQVNWELDAMDQSDIIVFYFDPDTKSPVTLMELGLHANSGSATLIVCCPEGFWRRGNVEIVCDRFRDITLVNTFSELVDELRDMLG